VSGLDLHAPLERLARNWAPRILTQLCRDATSPLYGCADRNWWHYKIRDFPSIILQQGGYATHLAGQHPGWNADAEALDAIAAASARFWNERAKKHYAFEEYYPWEQGYPPLAFSTLAMAKLAAAGVVPVADVRAGLLVAARQLRTRLEEKAGNQQVAGLAALAWIDKVLPGDADPAAFARQKARTLALQHEEGWYWEYDGPDLGYLSVTIDCLWDLYDATGDEDFRASIVRALSFTADFLAASPGGAGQHNSRNTDYLVPYGIVRSALEGDGAEKRDSTLIAATAFAGADRPDHFFAAVDDRYICHYIGQSVFRALLLLRDRPFEAIPAAAQQPRLIPGSGHYLGSGLVVSCRKGGIVTVTRGEAEASDFGWIVERGGQQFVSHWWSDAWRFTKDSSGIAVEGELFPHKERVSTPPRHMVLRLLSFLLGRRLTALLKRVLIFKRGGSGLGFARRISWSAQGVEIEDRITGLQPSDRLLRAPRASKRHVASADSFHKEDIALYRGFIREEERSDEGGGIRILTRLRPDGPSGR
jgi:hypothetical protein